MPPSEHTTAAFDRCVAVARAMAWSEDADVDVHHLLLCAMSSDDEFCRARLTLRALGVHHFFEDGADAEYTAAAAVIEATPRTMTRTMGAASAFDRLDHWAARTGDQTVDTVHLLLACLEAGADDDDIAEAFRATGTTVNDVVREAMTVRFYLSPADRQARARGPILSPTRTDRPAAHLYENLTKKRWGPRKSSTIRHRSQHPGTAEVGSPIRLYLFRIHLWWHVALVVIAVAQLSAVINVAITTPWALIWVVGPIPRVVAPTWARLLIVCGLTATSMVLGAPWWLAIGGFAVFALITIEGRFAVLEVRADVADPGVRSVDLRRDSRINAQGANGFLALKATRQLAAE